jgi:hypothetical protein
MCCGTYRDGNSIIHLQRLKGLLQMLGLLLLHAGRLITCKTPPPFVAAAPLPPPLPPLPPLAPLLAAADPLPAAATTAAAGWLPLLLAGGSSIACAVSTAPRGSSAACSEALSTSDSCCRVSGSSLLLGVAGWAAAASCVMLTCSRQQ